MGRYEFLEEVAIADCAVDVEGKDLNDLFETAAAVLAEVIAAPATVPTTMEREMTLTAPSLELLLYDWLSELIYVKDCERLVFTRSVVRVEEGAPCRLTASLAGGAIDAEPTARRADPKAVTLHQFALERTGSGWRARVIFDI